MKEPEDHAALSRLWDLFVSWAKDLEDEDDDDEYTPSDTFAEIMANLVEVAGKRGMSNDNIVSALRRFAQHVESGETIKKKRLN